MTTTFYKVLNHDGSPFHGGRGSWHLPRGSKLGEWMPTIDRIEPCRRGYHVVTLEQLIPWLGPALFEVEIAGDVVDAGDKIVVSRARLLRRVDGWNDRTARLFAADCALRALRRERKAGREPDKRSWAAVKAAQDFANGKIGDNELAAAWAAAWAAAGAATWAAARDAAWAATWAAARDAAWAATWAAARDAARDAAGAAAWAAAGAAAGDAARDAARDAAWAAAWAAETRWQTKRLNEYLTGKRGAK